MQSRSKSRALLFGCAMFSLGLPTLARAQHVVTEDEAGKLTLEALTAEPVYHPAYRSYVHTAMATRMLRHSAGRRAMVREVAYHGHVGQHRAAAHRHRT